MAAGLDRNPSADLRRQVARTLRDGAVSCAGARVLALCSGGVDSVTLVDLLATLPRGSRPREVEVLFLDHGLRDTDPDERAARAIAERHGLAFHVERAGGALATGGNLQARARAWRYEVAARMAAQLDARFVATGHTADDQLETLLYGLVASSGPRAVLGMPLLGGDDMLLRPLLTLARSEIVAHARARGIAWADDPGNATGDRFRRNALRHDVVPALLRAHPGAGANLVRTARQLRQQAGVTRSLAHAVLAGACGEDGAIDVRVVAALDPAARHAVLAEWLRLRGAGRALTERTVRAVDDLVCAPAGAGEKAGREPAAGRRVAVGPGCVVRARYHCQFHSPAETDR